MAKTADICQGCIAEGGLVSDRCRDCSDYSAFQRGGYSMTSLEGLSARGKLAWILCELARLKGAQADHIEQSGRLFVFPVPEQLYFKSKRLSQRKRCRACRAERKASLVPDPAVRHD